VFVYAPCQPGYSDTLVLTGAAFTMSHKALRMSDNSGYAPSSL
jgi:hypothetical protein